MGGSSFNLNTSPVWHIPMYSTPYTSHVYSQEFTGTIDSTVMSNGITLQNDPLFLRRYCATSSPFFSMPSEVYEYNQEIIEEDVPKMKLEEYEDETSHGHKYILGCTCESDLSTKRILKSLSIMKSKIMMHCAPYPIESLKCKMTPIVKNNIIMAYRKLNMFGKKTPFIACFDEYGRRLPDDVQLDTLQGMNIEIVNPLDNYGDNYLVFEAIVPDFPT